MQNFYIFPRTIRGKKIFYFSIVDDLTKKTGNAKSVDAVAKTLGIDRHITKKTEAYEIVSKAIESGVVKEKVIEDISFIQYLNDFWDWDKSFYVKRENKKKANSVGKDYVYNCATCVRLHVKPYISEKLKCSQVTKKHIQTLQEMVIEECSVSVWNNTLRALSVPIKELRRKEILVKDPLFDLDRYTPEVEERGILTTYETEKLLHQMYMDCTVGRKRKFKKVFAGSKALDAMIDAEVEKAPKNKQDQVREELEKKYDRYREADWKLDIRVYLATTLSALTGMRRGEIQALKVDSIRYVIQNPDQAIVEIKQAWARHAHTKLPKSKKTRQVAIPRWFAEQLLEFYKTNPWDNGYIFYSDSVRDVPLEGHVLSDWFNEELKQIGITEEERTERNIVFHSLRHGFNTMAITEMGEENTRFFTGHSSHAMSMRYDHATDERTMKLGKVTTKFFDNPENYEEKKELRVVAYLAGEQWVLDAFKNGKDIYCETASRMFSVPVEKHGQYWKFYKR